MHGGVLSRLRGRLLRRRHSVLLAAIVAAFALRPLIGNAGAAPIVFGLAVMGLMLVALYTIQVDELVGEREALLAERRRRSIAGWTLAGLALAGRLAALVVPNPRLNLAASICWLLFFGFVTWTELRGVLKQKEVTGETISMAISVYLLMGLTWALLFIVLYERHPEAFAFGGAPSPIPTAEADQVQIFATFVYFSLTTLATIGYGDITPVSLQARYAAVAEGITGQFYLAILVARLVSMQMSRPAARDSEDEPRGTEDP
jgi:hypothetical protein